MLHIKYVMLEDAYLAYPLRRLTCGRIDPRQAMPSMLSGVPEYYVMHTHLPAL